MRRALGAALLCAWLLSACSEKPAPAGPAPTPTAPAPQAASDAAPTLEAPPEITWATHIAPILDAKCSFCHREGQSGPFALLSWDEVYDHTDQIAEVVASGYMPPWKGKTQHPGGFSNDRSLSDADKATIAAWAAGGFKRGDLSKRPPVPVLKDGWPMGEPDLVVELPPGYTLPAEGTDIYRNFVIEAPLAAKPNTESVWVRAWDFQPTNARVVHHAILNVDHTGWARREAAADPEPGFGGMDVGNIQSPGLYLVWAPGSDGSAALTGPAGTAWELDRKTDLVLQLHMQPTGKPEPVGVRIGLYFALQPPARKPLTMRIGDAPLDIPPGEANYRVTDRLVIPVDGELYSAFPHAHYLGKRFLLTLTPPGGEPSEILRVDSWDFVWQDQYRWAQPITVAAGTVMDLEIVYDNSADNPANPSTPPVRVRAGAGSKDEMGNVTLDFVPAANDGGVALREWKYRRELERGSDPARAHYNLGNVLREKGALQAAVDEYESALALEPNHVHALGNLAVTLHELGRNAEAGVAAMRVLKLAPDDTAALMTLGLVENAAGRIEGARRRFEATLKVDPTHGAALNGLASLDGGAGVEALERAAAGGNAAATLKLADLDTQAGRLEAAIARLRPVVAAGRAPVGVQVALGSALVQSGQVADGIAELGRAVEAAPHDANARFRLGGALLATGKKTEARPHLEEAARLGPDAAPVYEALGVLEAQSGNLKAAAAHFERAVALAPGEAKHQQNLARVRALIERR
ncbi:MAG: tetratricopeptide repeat protein [Myxococcota bacterium]